VDALAARTLVKGEALAPPAGRADDYAWPRREIGREQAKGDTPVAPPRRAERWRQCPDRGSFCCRRRSKRYNSRRGSRSSGADADSAGAEQRAVAARFLRRFWRGAASACAACGRSTAWTRARRARRAQPGSVGRSAEVPPGNLTRF
jgi:hypothetical protein